MIRKFSKTVRFLGAFLRPYSWILIAMIFLNMTPGFLLGLRPLVLAPALGNVLPSDSTPAQSFRELSLDNLGCTLQQVVAGQKDDMASAFFLSGMLYFILTALIVLVGGLVTTWSMSIRLRIQQDMIVFFHKHLLGLHLGFFLRQKTGELISRFTTDLPKTALAIETVFSGVVNSFIQLLVYGLIMLRTDVTLTVQLLLVGSLHVAVTHLLGNKLNRYTKNAYDVLASLTSSLQETFQNIRVIKSFSAEEFDAAKIRKNAADVRHKHFRYALTRYIENPIRFLTDGFITVAILYISYQAIVQGLMTTAGMAMFFYMATQLVVPFSALARHFLSMYSIYGGFSRLSAIVNTKNELADGHLLPKHFQDSLSLQQVSFGYEETNILKTIQLEIKRGEIVGVVGVSGGGKSTLIDLILRLYDPLEGQLIFDGHDIREYNQTAYRNLFGVVSQECLLFNSSIRSNIVLGRDANDDDLDRACRIAHLQDFIDSLPNGFDTEVGDRGVRISGGQRQRIAIARAIYAHPEILILDEATSALDTESEQEVQAAINDAIKGVTAIIIAHRLSTIRHADKIVVLDQGRIESIGSHTDLLQKSSVYSRLFSCQL